MLRGYHHRWFLPRCGDNHLIDLGNCQLKNSNLFNFALVWRKVRGAGTGNVEPTIVTSSDGA